LLLSEVDLLKTKIKEQDETITGLKSKLEKMLKLLPESEDVYWEKASSHFRGFSELRAERNSSGLQSVDLDRFCVGSLNTEEIDYKVDGQAICQILSALKHNDKVKIVYLSYHHVSYKSYPVSGLKNNDFNNLENSTTGLWLGGVTKKSAIDIAGKGECNWYGEMFEKLADLIELNTTITNIQIGVTNIGPNEDLCKKLGKALSENLVLEELSFPVWAPGDPTIFHTIGPFIRKNKNNGGKLKTMKFWDFGLRNNTAMKSELDQFQILLKYRD
jgi:hypothetical protein